MQSTCHNFQISSFKNIVPPKGRNPNLKNTPWFSTRKYEKPATRKFELALFNTQLANVNSQLATRTRNSQLATRTRNSHLQLETCNSQNTSTRNAEAVRSDFVWLYHYQLQGVTIWYFSPIGYTVTLNMLNSNFAIKSWNCFQWQ